MKKSVKTMLLAALLLLYPDALLARHRKRHRNPLLQHLQKVEKQELIPSESPSLQSMALWITAGKVFYKDLPQKELRKERT